MAGAVIDDRYSPPIKLSGVVKAIEHGDLAAETEVVVQTGSINVIITKSVNLIIMKRFYPFALNPRKQI